MRRTWLAPLGLNRVSMLGLTCALLGDGTWDALSWVALALPVATCIYYWARSIDD